MRGAVEKKNPPGPEAIRERVSLSRVTLQNPGLQEKQLAKPAARPGGFFFVMTGYSIFSSRARACRASSERLDIS